MNKKKIFRIRFESDGVYHDRFVHDPETVQRLISKTRLKKEPKITIWHGTVSELHPENRHLL